MPADRNEQAEWMNTVDTTTLGCPVARTAEIIGNKWTPLIVRDLARGERRFSELERSLRGISPKTLSERLKRLEESAVIARRCYAEVPPRVEYSLTAKGHALLPVIESMREFGTQWLPDDASCDDSDVSAQAVARLSTR
jgi:DNA-binding HxlR family transcriptional regulator